MEPGSGQGPLSARCWGAAGGGLPAELPLEKLRLWLGSRHRHAWSRGDSGGGWEPQCPGSRPVEHTPTGAINPWDLTLWAGEHNWQPSAGISDQRPAGSRCSHLSGSVRLASFSPVQRQEYGGLAQLAIVPRLVHTALITRFPSPHTTSR